MPGDIVSIEYSEHICRVVSTALGMVLVGACAIILFIHLCRWIDKLLDQRQERIDTDRRVRIERARHERLAEKEGWRRHDEFIVQALSGYAKENYDMRDFMKKTKVIDLYEMRRAQA